MNHNSLNAALRKQLDVEQVKVEDHSETHTGKEEVNERERGKEGERLRW